MGCTAWKARAGSCRTWRSEWRTLIVVQPCCAWPVCWKRSLPFWEAAPTFWRSPSGEGESAARPSGTSVITSARQNL